MKRFKITSSDGVDMGTFDGETEAEALDAMARKAGFRDQADEESVNGKFHGKVQELDG